MILEKLRRQDKTRQSTFVYHFFLPVSHFLANTVGCRRSFFVLLLCGYMIGYDNCVSGVSRAISQGTRFILPAVSDMIGLTCQRRCYAPRGVHVLRQTTYFDLKFNAQAVFSANSQTCPVRADTNPVALPLSAWLTIVRTWGRCYK